MKEMNLFSEWDDKDQTCDVCSKNPALGHVRECGRDVPICKECDYRRGLYYDKLGRFEFSDVKVSLFDNDMKLVMEFYVDGLRPDNEFIYCGDKGVGIKTSENYDRSKLSFMISWDSLDKASMLSDTNPAQMLIPGSSTGYIEIVECPFPR